MRLIGLAVVLALILFAAPLVVEAQPAERVYRIGWLGAYPPEERAKVPANASASKSWSYLVAGSGLSFEDRGEYCLKGVPDRWQLWSATDRAPAC